MHFFKKSGTVFAALVAVLAICISGIGKAQDVGPSGEGNIPIGRAQGKEMGESAVTIQMSDGRMFYTFTRQQVIYGPNMPQGMTTVTVTPANRQFQKVEFSYYVGTDRFWNFNVRPTDRFATEVVKGMESSLLDGTVFQIGDEIDLNLQLFGANLDNLKPSIIVSGGVARIDADDRITCTKPGLGRIRITVPGFEKTINFVVVR